MEVSTSQTEETISISGIGPNSTGTINLNNVTKIHVAGPGPKLREFIAALQTALDKENIS